jgi:hypothetical protein
LLYFYSSGPRFPFFFFFFFLHTRVWAWFQGFVLARQVLFHLSHTPSPFCFINFSDRILCFCLSQPLWQSSYLHLQDGYYSCVPPHPACLLRWGYC